MFFSRSTPRKFRTYYTHFRQYHRFWYVTAFTTAINRMENSTAFILKKKQLTVKVRSNSMTSWFAVAKIGDAKVKIYDIKSHDDSDDSDGYSVSGDDVETESSTTITKMKWAQTLKVKFFSDREHKTKIAEMKVKAKGKATKKVTTVTRTDEEGNESTSSSTDIKKKVKKLIYKFEYEPTHNAGAKFEVHVKGKLHGKEAELEWQSPLFHATTKGWINQKAKVTTSHSDPAVGLLCGFLCAVELSPNDIADNVKVW